MTACVVKVLRSLAFYLKCLRHVGHGASPTNTPDGCWCKLAFLRSLYASSSPFCTPAILLSSPALGAHVDPEIEDQRRGNQRAHLQAAVSAPGVSPQEPEQGVVGVQVAEGDMQLRQELAPRGGRPQWPALPSNVDVGPGQPSG